jgi:hypothetical protein
MVYLPSRQDVVWVGAQWVARRLGLKQLPLLLRHKGRGVVTKD